MSGESKRREGGRAGESSRFGASHVNIKISIRKRLNLKENDIGEFILYNVSYIF
jgi:hypothetical protein